MFQDRDEGARLTVLVIVKMEKEPEFKGKYLTGKFVCRFSMVASESVSGTNRNLEPNLHKA